MRLIKTEDAVGHVLCHDMTQIIKDVRKDAVFRKGHIITDHGLEPSSEGDVIYSPRGCWQCRPGCRRCNRTVRRRHRSG